MKRAKNLAIWAVGELLPYAVNVYDDKRIEVTHRGYEVLLAGVLARRPTDRQLLAMSWEGKIVRAPGRRSVWLRPGSGISYDGQPHWSDYAERLKKLARLRLEESSSVECLGGPGRDWRDQDPGNRSSTRS